MKSLSNPHFSVVVPTYNRLRLLERTIESLLRQNIDHTAYEIIVVNDGCTDGTAEYLRSLSSLDGFRIIELKNSGPAIARNRGAMAARGEILAFVDDDCTVPSCWLQNVEEALCTHEAAAVGGSVANRVRESALAVTYQDMNQFFFRRYNREYGQARFLTGNNFACWRNVFQNFEGFDERFYSGAEDREFVARLIAAGERVCFVPQIEVDHYHSYLITSFLTHLYRQGRGSYLFYNVIAKEKNLDVSRPPVREILRLLLEVGRGHGFLDVLRVTMLTTVAQLSVLLGYLSAAFQRATDLNRRKGLREQGSK